MNRRPLCFITREKEWELIQKLVTLVDCSSFCPSNTCVIMASPDYSATVAMHLAHAWSVNGEIIPLIPVDVAYPDESNEQYRIKMLKQKMDITRYKNLVLIEAGIIRGGNWEWILDILNSWGYKKENITLIAMMENIHSKIKSDYVGEYYNDDEQELMFYYEKYNKHWPIK